MTKDEAWEHGQQIPNTRGGFVCNYCGLIMKSGGVTRLKYHLSGTDPRKNVKPCDQVPPEVKARMKRTLVEYAKNKERKQAQMEDIRAELRSGLLGVDDDEDEDDDNDEGFAYPSNLSQREKAAYKKAYHASKQSEWEREQKLKYSTGPGSTSGQPSRSSSMFQKSQSVREHEKRSTKISTSSLYKSESSKQKGMFDFFKAKSVKESVGRLAAKIFIYDNVPASKANSHHFKNMVRAFQVSGK